jgi:hypothetical protein
MKAVRNDETGLWVSKLIPFEYSSEDNALPMDDAYADNLAYELSEGVSEFQEDPEHPVPQMPHSPHGHPTQHPPR